MSKLGKEIAVGVVPVALLFLLFLGYNVLPVVVVACVAAAVYFISKQGPLAGINNKRRVQSRAPEKFTFEQIGGQERAKHELMEALDFLIHNESVQRFGIRPLKGILLAGPPGTGKTLMAKAAAHYTDAVFISASGSEFVEMYVGVGASRIRDLFKDARQRAVKEQKANAVIFIDEIDVIGGRREGGQHREYDQTLNQLLTEMDGIHQDEAPRILLIAATNRKEMLDSALLRPGRFDRHITVDLPDKKARLHILNLHAQNKPIAADVDLTEIAEQSFQFSGAQLESVMNEAAVYAMRNNEDLITRAHLAAAIDKTLMGERSDRTSSRLERERVGYHELGHAIVAELVKPGSVSQVTLTPRGQALGYVRHNPQQDQYMYTKEELEQQVMIALGGAVAEEMFYHNRSTGSQNDFQQVVKLVRMMIDCGLTSLGIIDPQMVTKEAMMKENAKIIDGLMDATKALLERNRSVFEQALAVLMKEEVLNGEQFREMISDIKIQSAI